MYAWHWTPPSGTIGGMAQRHVALAFPRTAGYHEEIIRGIEDYARAESDWTFLIAPETYDMSVLGLTGWPGDGVIADIFSREQAHAACKLGIPVVNLSGALADADLPRVMNDQRAIGRLGAEHLLGCEVRRFGYYGVKGVWYSRQRGQGFCERLKRAGHDCAILEAPKAFGKTRNWHHWLDELRQWLKTMKPPFGVMATSDNRARMVMDACRQLGLFVPYDVAVIGVDNDRFICEVSRPSLSSVARNGHAIGYRAARLLDQLMAGRRPPKHGVIVPPAGVVARESTDIVPVDDPDLSRAVRFIRENLGRPLTIRDVLLAVPVSRRWLEYRFRERFGHSPHDYICEARVERAKQLMVESPELRLEQIAAAVGFTGSRNFRQVFHRFTGTVPGEYRRSLQVCRRST